VEGVLKSTIVNQSAPLQSIATLHHAKKKKRMNHSHPITRLNNAKKHVLVKSLPKDLKNRSFGSPSKNKMPMMNFN